MARNKRFKILKTAIKKYKAPVTDPTSAFYHYDRFQKGLADYKVNGTNRGEDIFRLIDPFGASTTADPYRIKLTGRATTANITAVGLSELELGLAPIPDNGNFTVSRNFIPAKIIAKSISGTGEDPEISQITKEPYKRQRGSTITLPFGRIVDADRFFERQLALARTVEAAPGKQSVTFKPERLYQD